MIQHCTSRKYSVICSLIKRFKPLVMRILFTILVLAISGSAMSQTWSDDVATIFYEKCAKCHHTGGVGPFPLTTHAEVSPLATIIHDAVQQDEMPPWPPNNDYQQYVHDRSLTAAEKTTVLDWITNGTPEGTPGNTPPPPVFSSGSVLGNGDLEVQIPVYTSQALSTGDDYVCFAMPSNLPSDRIIRAVEIIPGNREIVHHALIYLDPAGNSTTDLSGDCGGPNSQTASLIMGYTPGSSPMTLPSVGPLKLGIPMPANSQVFFAMHYPEGSFGEQDSTKVIFHFYPPGETGIREVFAAPLLQNWSMVIPPNTFTPVDAQYPAGTAGVTSDFSILSVFPHMHLLGHDMKVYGVKQNLDTIPLIDVPHWDFEWQDFYFFKNIQKAEQGTTLYATGQYDNTTGNLHNPNNPPITVNAGLNTSDEMFLTYFHFMAYQPGDENYDMEDLMNQSTNSLLEFNNDESFMRAYPNPFNDDVYIYSNEVSAGDHLSVYVYNSQGKIVKRLAQNMTLTENKVELTWDGTNDAGEDVSGGLYMISVNRNGTFSHVRIMKK